MTLLPIVSKEAATEAAYDMYDTKYFYSLFKKLQQDNPVAYSIMGAQTQAAKLYCEKYDIEQSCSEKLQMMVANAMMDLYNTLDIQAQLNAQKEVQNKVKVSPN